MGVGNGNKAAALQFSTSCKDTEKSVLFLFSLKLCGCLIDPERSTLCSGEKGGSRVMQGEGGDL